MNLLPIHPEVMSRKKRKRAQKQGATIPDFFSFFRLFRPIRDEQPKKTKEIKDGRMTKNL